MSLSIDRLHEGDEATIKRAHGDDELRRRLEEMEVIPGEKITIIAETGGGYIVKLKDSRLGMGMEVAERIMTEPRGR